MKQLLLTLAALLTTATIYAQNGWEAPSDTVYMSNGNIEVVHIKEISPNKAAPVPIWKIQTQEVLEVVGRNAWVDIGSGSRWYSEITTDSISSHEVDKIVFSNGWELRFNNGEMDRSHLLDAPYYKEAHGDFMANGAVQLTRKELRQLIGEEAYLLKYRVKRAQSIGGVVKMAAGVPAVGLCIVFKNSAVKTVDNTRNRVGTIQNKNNPLWYTAIGAGAVCTVYGATEMLLANLSIHKLANNYSSFKAPSSGAFVTRTAVGSGLLIGGVGLTIWGYDRINKDAGWTETYSSLSSGTQQSVGKTSQTGTKMNVPWLIPAAGALLTCFGLTELTNGITGLVGYSQLRAAGLERAHRFKWFPPLMVWASAWYSKT